MDIPYAIWSATTGNSTTAALYYGFKTNNTPPPGLPAGCGLPDYTTNSYAFSELPFPAAPPNLAATNSFLTMMLTDSNLAGAEFILRRAVLGDSTFPAQTVYLEQTSDTARNVRYWEFDNAQLDARVRGDSTVLRILSSSTAFTNLLGLMTGLATFTLPPNAYPPGAICDSLTSSGGELWTATGQTPAIAFLEAGAAGSYGTITEPCDYLQKFPSPMDYFYQARGFSLAEAYYQSLQNPYQGIMLGEPLSAPFANPGEGDWSFPTASPVLSGVTNITPLFFASATNLPLGQVDLFVDGTFFQTMTNLAPAQGNILSVTINGISIQYSVAAGETLASLSTNLANALNSVSNSTRVMAYAIGDRLEVDGIDPGTPGANLVVAASAGIGTGANLTTFITAARPAFLDTMATGYVGVAVSNTPVAGDWVQVAFTKTNGTVIKVGVTNNVTGMSNNTAFVQRLYNAINANASLQTPDGVAATDFYAFGSPSLAEFNLFARTPGWPAAQIQAIITTSHDLTPIPTGSFRFQDNVSDLMPRNHLYLAAGATWLPVSYNLDTTQLADGYHTLTAVAYEGTSVRTQTSVSQGVVVQNTPLWAALTPVINTSSTNLEGLLQFSVTANTTNVAMIELFSTGGMIAGATNQASALFTTSFATLGTGLHPFYALVTDHSSNRYQTPTLSYRFPLIWPTVRPAAASLSWPALPGLTYQVLAATNATGPFQPAGSLAPTNSPAPLPRPTRRRNGRSTRPTRPPSTRSRRRPSFCFVALVLGFLLPLSIGSCFCGSSAVARDQACHYFRLRGPSSGQHETDQPKPPPEPPCFGFRGRGLPLLGKTASGRLVNRCPTSASRSPFDPGSCWQTGAPSHWPGDSPPA